MTATLDLQHSKAQRVYSKQRSGHKKSKIAWAKLHQLTVRILKRDMRNRSSARPREVLQ